MISVDAVGNLVDPLLCTFLLHSYYPSLPGTVDTSRHLPATSACVYESRYTAEPALPRHGKLIPETGILARKIFRPIAEARSGPSSKLCQLVAA
jgi:hypothetical protein